MMIVFDLDGTLAESKQPLDDDMVGLLLGLLLKNKVSIISGCSYAQFEKQVISRLSFGMISGGKLMKNLFLFPATGTAFYKIDENGIWQKIYADTLSQEQKDNVIKAINEAEIHLSLDKTQSFGPKIEDRGTQITYSGVGQDAPISAKKDWDPEQKIRRKIIDYIAPKISDLEIHMGGMTSIDITKKGIDKAFGIRKIQEIFNITKEEIIFVGDAMFPGGNDYPAQSTGVKCVWVKDVADTKRFISDLLNKN